MLFKKVISAAFPPMPCYVQYGIWNAGDEKRCISRIAS